MKMRILAILALLGCWSAGLAVETDKATGDAIKLGFTADKQAALARAKAEGKPLLAFFTTEWCGWCRRLEAEVLATPEFKAGSASWVKLVIDAEKGDGVDWARRFHVSGFPTLILLDAGGEEIDRQPGYSPMPDFLRTLQDFERGVGTLSALQAEQTARPGDHGLTLRIARKLTTRGRPDEATALLQGILAADPANLSGMADEAAAELALHTFSQEHDPAVLEAVLSTWKGVEQGPQIYNLLIAGAARAGDETRMRTLLDRAVDDYPEDAQLLNSYAWTCAEKGWNLEKAERLAERAVRLSGQDPNVLDTLAEVQFRRGQGAAARATIQQALAMKPGDAYLEGQLKRFQGQP